MTKKVEVDPRTTLLVSPVQVTRETGLSPGLQKKLRDADQFCPAIRIGGRLYYRRTQLEEWLNGVEAVEGPEREPLERLAKDADRSVETALLARALERMDEGQRLREVLGDD
jgi:hypothetical protein